MYDLTELDKARFWMKVKIKNGKTGPKSDNQCWEWNGAHHQLGYGIFMLNSKSEKAHRISYFLFNGKISKELIICHSCDNPKCVNPKHLWEGTQADNMKDMRNKKRDNRSKYKGVSYRRESGLWRARLLIKGENNLIGNFNTEEEAAKAYDKEVRKLNLTLPFRKKKTLNFPEVCQY